VSSTSTAAGQADGDITVSVQEDPSIITTVGPDGTFTLRGLPAGGFTLIFTQDGQTLGSLTFSEVLPNQEIMVTVDVSDGTVILIEQRRDGIGHGDIEIEGLVEEVQSLDPGGDSTFVIAGYTVVARPGETAIREGNQPRTVDDVTEGRQVHVKGVWITDAGTPQPVLAHRIDLQGDDADDDTGGGDSCMIDGAQAGRGIQLEGRVDSGNANRFKLRVDGNRARHPVDVDAGGASFKCSPQSGPNAPTTAECKAMVEAGAKVHVSGDLTSCSASAALVTASEVKPQK
jgi:hypothetical protein